jgi:hypothetical protein
LVATEALALHPLYQDLLSPVLVAVAVELKELEQ